MTRTNALAATIERPTSAPHAGVRGGGRRGRRRVVMVLENDGYPFDSRVRCEAETLASAGLDVEVLAPREANRPRREVVGGVGVTRFPCYDGKGAPARTLLEYVVATAAVTTLVVPRLLASREGVLHVHNPPDLFFPLLWLARRCGWATVFDHHDDAAGVLRDKLGRHAALEGLMRWMCRCSARAADLTITTNLSQRSLVDADARRTAVVRNAPPSWFAQHRATPPAGRARMVFLGELGSQDHVVRAVDVLAVLTRQHGLDVDLLIIGDGPERARVEQRADDLSLADRVTITGFVPYEHVPPLLASAHVGIDTAAATEVNHGSTMVKISEYLVVGLPVVATALRETAVTGADAVRLITDADPRAYADAVAELLRDEETWRAAAARARTRGECLQWPEQGAVLRRAYADLGAQLR